MANKNYKAPVGKGFTPNSQQSRQPRSSSQVPSNSALSRPIAHQQELLEDLETSMEEMGDEFADRAAEIIEQGIHNSYVKAADRIKAIELPFFGLKGGGSYFASSRIRATESFIDIPSLASVEEATK